ncbi:alpha/beta hydrolase [Pararobbsia silviterrae]|uniref:Phospholipase n=1 Tax=Pararobbsia silviterrae TaxID=1792498 RepID=A0A494XJK1_9BURK|nr:phospholipase [Pararobbsia silviterrae]RKP47743.1 phospholipase [Pararobbsia silviterrae]
MNTLHHDTASGLAYRIRPANGNASARLFLLHGVGGNETNLLSLADTLSDRFELIFVRGPLTLGPAQHAWFEVRFTPEGPVIHAEQADASRLRLRALVRSLRESDAGAAVPALMAGFSQGGILSASVALTSPDDVAGFAILSGRILPEIEPHLASREQLARLSAFIAHGEHDDKLRIAFAEHADAWLTRLGVPHALHRYPIGHALSADVVRDFSQWLDARVAIDASGRAHA